MDPTHKKKSAIGSLRHQNQSQSQNGYFMAPADKKKVSDRLRFLMRHHSQRVKMTILWTPQMQEKVRGRRPHLMGHGGEVTKVMGPIDRIHVRLWSRSFTAAILFLQTILRKV